MKRSSFVPILFTAILFSFLSTTIKAQTTDSLVYSFELIDIIDMAIEKSTAVKYAQNRNQNYYWRWRNFKTKFRPQLVLSGNLPDYKQSTEGITQPDGSILFKQVSNLSTSARLSLNQSIPYTGTYIYASTSAVRFQDFNKNTIDFSGSPFSIGFVQPIFAVNWDKWAQKTEPLVYDEAQKYFIQSIEEIAYKTTNRFFKYLMVQTNYKLAESNLKNSNNNLKIAQTKKELGKISENDFARIELAVLNAQKSLSQASIALKNADFELKSYVGIPQDQTIELRMPLNMFLYNVDPEKALEQARENRKESSEYERRLIEADRNLISAKRNNGPKMTLRGSYGLSQGAETMAGIYEDPEREQTLKLTVSVPVLDWGKSASAVKLAESKRDLVIFDVEKDRIDFERSVVVQVEQFGLMKEQMAIAKKADKVAESGYLIALKLFQNGEISITNLNIALSERENAKRDYIRSLQTYWESYYRIRILTLYDFILDRKIYYENPMRE